MQDIQHPFAAGGQLTPDQTAALINLIRKTLGIKAANGITSAPAGSTAYAVAHGLGITPNMISVSTYVGGVAANNQPPFAWVNQSTPADSTNIYIDTTNVGGAKTFYWAAAHL